MQLGHGKEFLNWRLKHQPFVWALVPVIYSDNMLILEMQVWETLYSG